MQEEADHGAVRLLPIRFCSMDSRDEVLNNARHLEWLSPGIFDQRGNCGVSVPLLGLDVVEEEVEAAKVLPVGRGREPPQPSCHLRLTVSPGLHLGKGNHTRTSTTSLIKAPRIYNARCDLRRLGSRQALDRRKPSSSLMRFLSERLYAAAEPSPRGKALASFEGARTLAFLIPLFCSAAQHQAARIEHAFPFTRTQPQRKGAALEAQPLPLARTNVEFPMEKASPRSPWPAL